MHGHRVDGVLHGLQSGAQRLVLRLEKAILVEHVVDVLLTVLAHHSLPLTIGTEGDSYISVHIKFRSGLIILCVALPGLAVDLFGARQRGREEGREGGRKQGREGMRG